MQNKINQTNTPSTTTNWEINLEPRPLTSGNPSMCDDNNIMDDINNTTDNKIDHFFGNNFENNNESVLRLLRKDIGCCFNPDNQILFPGVILIMTGVDLLSKFFDGNDNTDDKINKRNKMANNSKVGVRYRFKKYLNKYFFDKETEPEAELLYQLRNAITHSFGLYSESESGIKYFYELSQTSLDFIFFNFKENKNEYKITINVHKLHDQFNKSISKYHANLINGDSLLKENFDKMYKKYGVLKTYYEYSITT